MSPLIFSHFLERIFPLPREQSSHFIEKHSSKDSGIIVFIIIIPHYQKLSNNKLKDKQRQVIPIKICIDFFE